MQPFTCPSCAQSLYFDNTDCLSCGRKAYVDVTARTMVLDAVPCANAELISCNWPAAEPGGLCEACLLTRTVPDHGHGAAVLAWRKAELQKRRLLWQLEGIGLPVVGFREDPDHGLAFDLLWSDDGSVTTGHADGLITIDLGESDDARRVRLRNRLGERYRTMLGHFRHEIGHYYWPMLAAGDDIVDRTRDVFGDERADYAQALESHYSSDPPQHWEESYVSVYAAAHPWEDWAETFAHVLHVLGVMETVGAFGLRLVEHRDRPSIGTGPTMSAILDEWVPMSLALNAVNRSMGLDDLYPFVLSPLIRQKMEFVHQRIVQRAGDSTLTASVA